MEIFRNLKNNLFAKIMLIIIALSFVVVGGVSTTGLNDNTIASVNGKKIYANETNKIYKNQINQMSLNSLSSKELKQLRLVEQVLEHQINFKSAYVHSKESGLSVSDNQIAKKLNNIKYFQSVGRFDELKFKRVLSANRLTPEKFLSDIRKELIVKKYQDIFSNIKFKPKNISRVLANHKAQKRNITKASLSLNDIEVQQPSDKQLKTFYNNQKQSFKINEKRDVVVLHISTKKIANSISDKQARKTYEKNIQQFDTPETRSFYKVGGTKEQLAKLKQEYTKTKDIKSAIKKSIGGNPQEFFTKLSPASAIDKNTKTTLFKLQKGKLSHPISVGFGEVVLFVTEIKKGKKSNFDKIKNEIKMQMAQAKILDVITETEDLVAEDKELSEISKTLGIKNITIDKLSIDGNNKYQFSKNPKFSEVIFEAGINETTDVIELNENSYIVANVNKIYKSYIPEFNKIKNKIIKSYIADARTKKSTKSLNALKNIKTEKEFNAKAKKLGFKLTNINNLTMNKALSDNINAIAYEGNKNSVQTTGDNKTVYAIYIKQIKIPDNTTSKQVKEVSQKINATMFNNTLNAVFGNIKNNQDIERNNRIINAIYEEE